MSEHQVDVRTVRVTPTAADQYILRNPSTPNRHAASNAIRDIIRFAARRGHEWIYRAGSDNRPYLILKVSSCALAASADGSVIIGYQRLDFPVQDRRETHDG